MTPEEIAKLNVVDNWGQCSASEADTGPMALALAVAELAKVAA